MNWTAFATTLPVVGQGFGPSDLLLVLWPATVTNGPVVAVTSTAGALAANSASIALSNLGAPSYWASIPAAPVAPTAVVTPAAQVAALQAVISSLAAVGASNPALEAALATVQAAATPVVATPATT